jgi:hypothetical protein
MGQLCDAGCTVAFTATDVTICVNGDVVLIGKHTPDTKLWHLRLPIPTPLSEPSHSAFAAVGSATPTELVAFAHAALFSPVLSTLLLALEKGFLNSFPVLTPALLRKYPPRSIAMVKGHLDQSRRNQCSTRATPPPPPGFVAPSSPPTTPSFPDSTELDDQFPSSSTPNDRSHHCFAAVMEPTGQIFTDQTGRFVAPSSNGNNYLLLVYDFDSNSILAKPIKSRTGSAILTGYQTLHAKAMHCRPPPPPPTA